MSAHNDGHYLVEELLRQLCLSEKSPEQELSGEAASFIRFMEDLPGGF